MMEIRRQDGNNDTNKLGERETIPDIHTRQAAKGLSIAGTQETHKWRLYRNGSAGGKSSMHRQVASA